MIVTNLTQEELTLLKLNSKISVNTIVIFDDIQDNLHFKDFVESNKKNFNVFEYQGKYIGVTGLDNF